MKAEPAGGPLDMARSVIRDTLSKYFRSGKRLDAASSDVLNALAHMLTVHPVKKKPKGATVMTESAATKRADGTYGTKPQHL